MTTMAPLSTISFVQKQPSLLVTSKLEKAIEECKKKVARIARGCRAKNRKFRDLEFDLEGDKERCLHGVLRDSEFSPADVHRVTQIFEKPRFFGGETPDSSDIVQGYLGDCWFLSALATVSNVPGLVKRFCVARDETVGVYGFIFFRDNGWESVIIDDLLFTVVPKWEELKGSEQALYHYDKNRYNTFARHGGKTLYFARSGSLGETWVPLIEKAYAKLHGNYSRLVGGYTGEGIEDLTGGVSSILQTKDILDPDQFWREEILRANKDRLFSCYFNSLSNSRNGLSNIRVQGLIGSHAYSVLRAVECRGKRFLVVRNPWGESEWTGPWSDGSKEWTKEWLEILDDLGHVFGDDGQFVMEYKDWLDCFSDIERTVLFDSSWIMSSQWLRVPCRPLPTAWSYGDISFTFTLPTPSLTVLVLSQLDERYFRDVASRSSWNLNFVLVKASEQEPLAESVHNVFWERSVNLEIELEAGEYFVYVRIDREIDSSKEYEPTISDSMLRHLSYVMAARAKSRSIASNFDQAAHANFIPTSLDSLINRNYQQYQKYQEKKLKEEAKKKAKDTDNDSDGKAAEGESQDVDEDGVETITTTTTTTVVETVKKAKKPKPLTSQREAAPTASQQVTASDAPDPTKYVIKRTDEDDIYLGLRVYTHEEAPAVVVGILKAAGEKEGETKKEEKDKKGDGKEGEAKKEEKDKKGDEKEGETKKEEKDKKCDEKEGETKNEEKDKKGEEKEKDTERIVLSL